MLVDNIQRQRDLKTIQSISSAVEELIQTLNEVRKNNNDEISQRGYFTPDEEAQAKNLFFTFRNHRAALLDIINRYRNYDNIINNKENARSFTLGLSAALLLYNWSSYLVHLYKDVTPVRKKLNEVDDFFGVEENLFDTIYANLTSLQTQQSLLQAVTDFEEQKSKLIPILNEDFYILIDKLIIYHSLLIAINGTYGQQD